MSTFLWIVGRSFGFPAQLELGFFMRVAVYGGSFNPPHIAHVFSALYVLSVMPVERVLVVPVYEHALDKRLAAFHHRVAMCRLAMDGLRSVEVSEVEAELAPPSYTLNTLEYLRSQHPDWQMRLVVGADVLHESHRWHAFEKVCALAPLLVLGRASVQHPEAPPAVLPEVSSSEIREWLKRPRVRENERRLDALVPQAVRSYIDAHGLYAS